MPKTFCPHCGSPLPEGAKFCPGCGAAREVQQPAPAAPEPPRPPRRKSRLLPGILLGAAAVTVVCAVLLLTGALSFGGADTVEGRGFSSPEAAAESYLEALRRGDGRHDRHDLRDVRHGNRLPDPAKPCWPARPTRRCRSQRLRVSPVSALKRVAR